MIKSFIRSLFVLLSLCLLVTVGFGVTAEGYECPYGITNDQYPGQCGLYVDDDSDGYCDLGGVTYEGESTEDVHVTTSDHDLVTGQELKTMTVEDVAKLYGVSGHDYAYALREYYGITDIHHSTSFQLLHDNYGVDPSVAKNIINELAEYGNIEAIMEEEGDVERTLVETPSRPKYPFIPIVLILVLLYSYTYSLYRAKVIRKLTHLRIWNVALLFSFSISAILGILLVIRINYHYAFDFLPFNMLYWHVEGGIVMAVLCFFHIANHYKYFLIMVKRKKK